MAHKLLEQYPELKRLQRRIRRSKGEFSLFFVECNLPTLRHELANVLSEQLENPAVQITLPQLSENLIQFDQLIAEHIKDEPLDSSVFLFSLENWLPTLSKETLHQTVQQLNWRRSSFARLNRPLVIWLPKYAIDLLAEHTPDFYDWYSGVFVFKAGKQVQSFEIKDSLQELYRHGGAVNASDYISYEETRRWLHTLKSLLAEADRSDQDRVRLLNEIALLYHKLGDLDNAQSCFEESLNLVQDDDSERLNEAAIISNISQIYIAKGKYGKALEYLEQALTLDRALQNKYGECVVLNNISQIHRRNGDYKTALEYLQQSYLLAGIVEDKANKADVLNNISSVYYGMGNYGLASQFLDEALKLYEGIGHKSGECEVLSNKAIIAIDEGKYETAHQLLEKALELAKEIGNRFGTSLILGSISLVHTARGDHDKAIQYLMDSLEIKKEIGDLFGEPSILIRLGNVYWDKGNRDKASEQWMMAYAKAKETDNFQALRSLGAITTQLDEGEMKDWEIRAEKTK